MNTTKKIDRLQKLLQKTGDPIDQKVLKIRIKALELSISKGRDKTAEQIFLN